MRFTLTKLACAASLGIFALTAQAANDTKKVDKDSYKAAVKQADSDYKAAKDACSAKSGNDKDVCVKQAKANYTKAKADAKAARKTRDARADATDDKMKAEYKVAKERCDSMSGDAKDSCVKQAKAKYNQ